MNLKNLSSLNSSNNIYAKAYKKVWDSLPNWRRNEIIEIINKNDLNNKYYSSFIQEVIEIAEKPTCARK